MKEALAYFGGDAGFRRLFSLFKAKYESYGRVGGSIKLTTFSDSEIESIAQFYGTDLHKVKQKNSVTLLSFQKKLQETKFEGVTLHALLEAYFGEELLSKKEAKDQKLKQQENLLHYLEVTFPSLQFWFTHTKERSANTHWIYRLLEQPSFKSTVATLARAIERLPHDYERLPMFSQRVTGNPHSFDLSTELGKLWIYILHVKREGGHTSPPNDTESVNELLQEYKLLRDDITNYVTVANILAETKHQIHPMWQAAADTSSVMNVPLRELLAIKNAYPKNTNSKDVWIVENSGVYSSLLDAVPEAPLLCTHGQFKLAALKLMDILVEYGCILHYGGDFDPEGVAIAARLRERYPGKVVLWRMDRESYLDSKPSVKLTGERLLKLKGIVDCGLVEVIEEMELQKMAGYQEGLLEVMVGGLLDRLT